jgi:hypothetical protein
MDLPAGGNQRLAGGRQVGVAVGELRVIEDDREALQGLEHGVKIVTFALELDLGAVGLCKMNAAREWSSVQPRESQDAQES